MSNALGVPGDENTLHGAGVSRRKTVSAVIGRLVSGIIDGLWKKTDMDG